MDWYKQAAELGLPFPVKAMDLLQNADKKTDGEDKHGTGKGMEIILEGLNGAVFSGELLPDVPLEVLALTIIFSMHGSIIHLQKAVADNTKRTNNPSGRAAKRYARGFEFQDITPEVRGEAYNVDKKI